jgi:hypothetical protein
MFKHPTTYTFLGFHFNALIDEGHFLDLRETHEQIRNKTLFRWLTSQFKEGIDISLFNESDLNRIESFFESMSLAVNEGRKMGVRRNGLCLLVAYCFQAAQSKESELYQ